MTRRGMLSPAIGRQAALHLLLLLLLLEGQVRDRVPRQGQEIRRAPGSADADALPAGSRHAGRNAMRILFFF